MMEQLRRLIIFKLILIIFINMQQQLSEGTTKDIFLAKSIEEYMKQLIKSNNPPNYNQYSTTLIKLLLDMNDIFQYKINKYLLVFFTTKLYRSSKHQPQKESNEFWGYFLAAKGYMKYYWQIIVRVIIFGLRNIVASDLKEAFWKKELIGLIRSCKLQIQFSCQSINFSYLLQNDLEIISQYFNVLEFYEQLSNLFQKCQLSILVTWASKKILDLKQKRPKQPIVQSSSVKNKSQQKNPFKASLVQNNQWKSRPSEILKKVLSQNKIDNRKSLSRTLHLQRKHKVKNLIEAKVNIEYYQDEDKVGQKPNAYLQYPQYYKKHSAIQQTQQSNTITINFK